MAMSNAQPIQFWPISEETYNEKAVCGVNTECFCQPIELTDEIILVAASEWMDDARLEAYNPILYDENDNVVFDTTGYGSSGIKRFTPFDEGIPEGKYYFKINLQASVGGDPAVFFYKSDCLDFRTTHECTELITYSNNKDFAGLPYENQSPMPEFSFRAPMVFFHEDFPDDQEVHPKSDDTWMRLSSRLEKKRRIDFGYMPYYMHEKIQLILMQDNVEIDGLSWEKRDAYKIDDASRRYGLRKSSVWLTDKNYIKRNQI